MFTKITKKQFVEDMTNCTSILVYGGSCKNDLVSDEWFDRVVEVCEGVDIDNAEQRTGIAKSNRIVFIDEDGVVLSSLCLDTKGTHTYYEYGNIRISKTHTVEKASERCGFDIDSMNFAIYVLV
jgi:hypothetical protein